VNEVTRVSTRRVFLSHRCNCEQPDGFRLQAPYSCPAFTVQLPSVAAAPQIRSGRIEPVALREVPSLLQLQPGTCCRQDKDMIVCFDLAKGVNRIIAMPTNK